MDNISCITERELNTGSMAEKFLSVRSLNSIEDVSTLLETFESALLETDTEHIVDVVENASKYYLFVVNEEGNSGFDFYTFLNTKYKGTGNINCVNAKFIFPMGKSRGLYSYEVDMAEDDTGNCDDSATGYMDEEELDEVLHGDNHYLMYSKLNTKIPISYAGVTIGRSGKYSDYIIQGNIKISRKHCKVYKDGASYKVHDFDSSNGTYVDGLKVHSSKDETLVVGSKLMLADEEFELV